MKSRKSLFRGLGVGLLGIFLFGFDFCHLWARGDPAPTQLPPSHQGQVPSLHLVWLDTYYQHLVRNSYSGIIVDIFAWLFVVLLCCVFLIPDVLWFKPCRWAMLFSKWAFAYSLHRGLCWQIAEKGCTMNTVEVQQHNVQARW